MAIKQTDLNNELGAMKKWLNILNEDNRIGIGHFPAEERSPDYRESWGESSELGNQPGSEMSGYMDEEEEVENDIYEFTIPEWAVSALINGDVSGLDDENSAKINSFVDNTVARYGNANFSLPSDDEMDLGFCRSNDIDGLGSNCMKLLLRSDGKKSEPEAEVIPDEPDPHAGKTFDDFESGAVYETEDEEDTEEHMGDVKLSMAIMSHLSDIQMTVDSTTRKKLNFIKELIGKLAKTGDIMVTDAELDALHSKWLG